MSHLEQRQFIEFIKNKYPLNFNKCGVLEIGSLNINGTVRDFFTDCEYIGLDVASGKDVDVVCQGQDYTADDNTFDTVISCEAMEHNLYWLETFINMHRICKIGGLVIMTCATHGRPEHGTTQTNKNDSPFTVELGWDYYRNLNENDFINNFDFNNNFTEHGFLSNSNSFDLYFFGIKQ